MERKGPHKRESGRDRGEGRRRRRQGRGAVKEERKGCRLRCLNISVFPLTYSFLFYSRSFSFPSFVWFYGKMFLSCRTPFFFDLFFYLFCVLLLADMNECQKGNGGCSHYCRNTRSSFRCSCPQGYVLHTDKKTCFPGTLIIFDRSN